MPAEDLGSTQVTPTKAAHVLWHFADGVRDVELALEPGDFVKALIALVARADPHNKRRLGLGFPGYVLAVHMAQDTEPGMGQLRQIAAAREADTGRPSITCPTCQRTSHHPEDVRHGWCSHCHGYTSPPFGTPVDGPVGVKHVPHRYCDRCASHVATLTWAGDDHVVVMTGNLVTTAGPIDADDQVRMSVWAPAELTWCSRVDWEATRA